MYRVMTVAGVTTSQAVKVKYIEFITLGIVQDEHLSYESIHYGSISLLYNYFNLD